MEDGLDPAAIDRTTLNMLYDSYISQKFDLKDTTKSNYMYMYDHFVRRLSADERLPRSSIPM